jgi:hypothetical protein
MIRDDFRTVDFTQQKTCVGIALVGADPRKLFQAAMIRRRKGDVRNRGIVHDMPPCSGFPRGEATHQIY